eukprot:COSAG01_NODE_4900_length_4642_cov_34.906229_3_plen_103_part_00
MQQMLDQAAGSEAKLWLDLLASGWILRRSARGAVGWRHWQSGSTGTKAAEAGDSDSSRVLATVPRNRARDPPFVADTHRTGLAGRCTRHTYIRDHAWPRRLT